MQNTFDLEEIFEAIKLSAIQIETLIRRGDTGTSSSQNSTGDTQLQLDIASDELIETIFKQTKTVHSIVSEEKNAAVEINKNARLFVAYDPLDGSSLVDVNLSIGTIYGIYLDGFGGKNIIGAAYIVYGPRVELVIADGKSVVLYRLFENKFVAIQNISLELKGKIMAPGGTQKEWFGYHKQMIDDFFAAGYRLRYSGGMVPDLHQILLKGGGLFSYPGTKDKPQGKLRQLFEVFPFAFIFKQANGATTTGFEDPLAIETKTIHDTSVCFFGSKTEIDLVNSYYAKHR